MKALSHIVEPDALLLTWQPVDENAPSRSRRVVGEVRRNPGQSRDLIFRYLVGTMDWKLAVDHGFKGYPAFQLSNETHQFDHGVLDTFLRRLPPRTREDFPEFLDRHALPSPFHYSEMALLAYTGARLPGDGFALVPVFPKNVLPCEYILELAGVRHVFGNDVSSLKIGDAITFRAEIDNEHDDNAVAAYHRLGKLGYVNRALLPAFNHWLEGAALSGVIERINGKAERPLIYVRVMAV